MKTRLHTGHGGQRASTFLHTASSGVYADRPMNAEPLVGWEYVIAILAIGTVACALFTRLNEEIIHAPDAERAAVLLERRELLLTLLRGGDVIALRPHGAALHSRKSTSTGRCTLTSSGDPSHLTRRNNVA